MGRAIDRALGGGGDGSPATFIEFVKRAAERNPAAANAKASIAGNIVDSYTGDDALHDLKVAQGKIASALSDPGATGNLRDAGKLSDARQALDAYTHAVQTYLSPAEKKAALDKADVAIAQARTPAAKAAATEARARLELSGQIVTKAQAEADAHNKGATALATASKAGAGHAASLARDAASMDMAARGALALADAYLQGGSAALIAEARAKASTDATKKGIDIEAQVRRQLALNVAEGAANGAKAVAQLRDETAARAAANDNVSGGTLAVEQMNRALSDEAVLRPLLKLQAVAQGDALVQLTKIIDAYRKSLGEAHAEEARSNARQALAATDENILRMRDAAEFAGDRSGHGDVEVARRAAQREAARRTYNDADTTSYVDNQVSEARTKLTGDRAKYLADTRNSQKDALELSTRELSLVGASADKREAILAHLKAELDLKARGVDLSSDEAKAVLAGVDAEDALNAKLRAANSAWSEVAQAGDQFIDDVLNPDNWNSFGDLGKKVLHDLEMEFLKLAALNPLKNALFGESNPTLGSVGSLLGNVLHFASGTQSFGGGLAYVNDNGQELMDLPNGTRIYPASETRRMLAGSGQSGSQQVVVKVEANDYFDAKVASISGGQINAAAPSIAAGGARLSGISAAKARRRKLGRY